MGSVTQLSLNAISGILGKLCRQAIGQIVENNKLSHYSTGFPDGSDCRVCLQCRRPRFDPCVGKIPWRREWLPIPVFLPEESLGQRSLWDYNPWDCKEMDQTE